MSKAHLPPVPPDNRAPIGPNQDSPQGDMPERVAKDTAKSRARHIEQQGRQGNINQNTRNDGYQQDR
jgi:hypothetical protein